MKFTGKSEEVASRIVDSFRTGSVPKALANVFIRGSERHCESWSWSNRFLVAIYGYSDARGFRQWEEVGRHVRKGEKAMHILGPCLVKRSETDDAGQETERGILVGFRSIPVFGTEQTEGDPIKGSEQGTQVLANLPLREVAESWGLRIGTYDGREGKALGYYAHGTAIALGVENLSTWAHELVHAAEDRLGVLPKCKGNRNAVREAEIVAELGGSVLLTMLGHETAADTGGAWDYIQHWAGEKHPVSACMAVLNRVCAAVDFIVNAAHKIGAAEPANA